MLDEKRFADSIHQIKEMDDNQLAYIYNYCANHMKARQERFEILCAGLYSYLQALQEEFPQSHVYLCENGKPDLDLMDFIIPENTYECCRIYD